MPIPLPSDSPRRPAPCPEPTARHSPSKTKTIRIPSAAPHFQDQHRRLTAASPQAPGSIGPFTSSKQPFPAADIKYSIHAHSPLVVPTNSTGGPTPFPEPAPPPDSHLIPAPGSIGPFTSSKQPFPAASIKYSIHAYPLPSYPQIPPAAQPRSRSHLRPDIHQESPQPPQFQRLRPISRTSTAA